MCVQDASCQQVTVRILVCLLHTLNRYSEYVSATTAADATHTRWESVDSAVTSAASSHSRGDSLLTTLPNFGRDPPYTPRLADSHSAVVLPALQRMRGRALAAYVHVLMVLKRYGTTVTGAALTSVLATPTPAHSSAPPPSDRKDAAEVDTETGKLPAACAVMHLLRGLRAFFRVDMGHDASVSYDRLLSTAVLPLRPLHPLFARGDEVLFEQYGGVSEDCLGVVPLASVPPSVAVRCFGFSCGSGAVGGGAADDMARGRSSSSTSSSSQSSSQSRTSGDGVDDKASSDRDGGDRDTDGTRDVDERGDGSGAPGCTHTPPALVAEHQRAVAQQFISELCSVVDVDSASQSILHVSLLREVLLTVASLISGNAQAFGVFSKVIGFDQLAIRVRLLGERLPFTIAFALLHLALDGMLLPEHPGLQPTQALCSDSVELRVLSSGGFLCVVPPAVVLHLVCRASSLLELHAVCSLAAVV